MHLLRILRKLLQIWLTPIVQTIHCSDGGVVGVSVPCVGVGHAVHRPCAGHGLLLRHDGDNHLEEQGPRQRRGQPSDISKHLTFCFCIS